jgi:hypothetical protein
MIKLKDLEGLKLVQPGNFGQEVETLGALEHAITQGSQGWGVSPSIAVQLHLARDLKVALELAEGAQETKNALKGKQMELGRKNSLYDALKEKLDKLLAAE